VGIDNGRDPAARSAAQRGLHLTVQGPQPTHLFCLNRRKAAVAAVNYYSADTMTGAGASRLADKIRNYWRARGYTVEVTVIDTTTTIKTGPIYCVRSNLIAGLPPSPDRQVYHGDKPTPADTDPPSASA
jgi:hypothetical protein